MQNRYRYPYRPYNREVPRKAYVPPPPIKRCPVCGDESRYLALVNPKGYKEYVCCLKCMLIGKDIACLNRLAFFTINDRYKNLMEYNK